MTELTKEEEIKAAKGRLARHLARYHRLTLDDVEITEARGYWRTREECGGRGICKHPIHRALFCEGPTKHTISYFEGGRDAAGRWTRRHQTWELLRQEAQA